MGKIGMKKLAEMIGMSTSTVSRAFRSPHLVHAKTRDRILQVARDSGYIYDAAAGDLSSKTSTVIGVLVPTTKRSLFSDSLLAIQDKTQEKNFSIIIGYTKYDSTIERKLLKQFQGRRVAGMILTGFGFGHESLVEEIIKSGIPCVVIWEKLDNSVISYVGFDNFKAAYSVTQYLISLRHRRIGLIIGPYSKVGRTKKRLEGYRSALADHGIPFNESLVVERDLDLIEGEAHQHHVEHAQQPAGVGPRSQSQRLVPERDVIQATHQGYEGKNPRNAQRVQIEQILVMGPGVGVKPPPGQTLGLPQVEIRTVTDNRMLQSAHGDLVPSHA